MNVQMTRNAAPGNPTPAINWKTVLRFALVALFIPMLLFIAAGRIDWWQGWFYALATIVVSIVSRTILYRTNPDLIAERARFIGSEGTKSWDKRLVVLIALVGPVATMITAGLDKRLGWSAEMPLAVHVGAIVIFLLGYALATWALIVNRFFSAVVRIQTERGHTVVTSGPYRFIRHPGYSGGIVSWLVSPLVLGSLWAFIPTGIVIGLYVIRTALEDRTLQAELPGYADYARRVRSRLIPGVW